MRDTDEEQHFVSHILAFFAASDGIVVENLGARFMSGEQNGRVQAVCQLCGARHTHLWAGRRRLSS